MTAQSHEQGTEEWHTARAGKITASRFSDALAFNKRNGGPTDTQLKYMRTLIAEILSGRSRHQVSSKSMSWGSDVEFYAREAYELETGNLVQESGFMLHPKYKFIGCSPDGLVGTDGGIEMKCPMDESVHIQTLLEGMPKDHEAQVHGCMFVTGAKWWDFVSYDPRQSDDYRLYIQRINRDEEKISAMEEGLLAFWVELQNNLHIIKEKRKRR